MRKKKKKHRTKWSSIALKYKLIETLQSIIFQAGYWETFSQFHFHVIGFHCFLVCCAASLFGPANAACGKQRILCFCACKRLVLRLNLLPSWEQCDLVRRHTPTNNPKNNRNNRKKVGVSRTFRTVFVCGCRKPNEYIRNWSFRTSSTLCYKIMSYVFQYHTVLVHIPY